MDFGFTSEVDLDFAMVFLLVLLVRVLSGGGNVTDTLCCFVSLDEDLVSLPAIMMILGLLTPVELVLLTVVFTGSEVFLEEGGFGGREEVKVLGERTEVLLLVEGEELIFFEARGEEEGFSDSAVWCFLAETSLFSLITARDLPLSAAGGTDGLSLSLPDCSVTEDTAGAAEDGKGFSLSWSFEMLSSLSCTLASRDSISRSNLGRPAACEPPISDPAPGEIRGEY